MNLFEKLFIAVIIFSMIITPIFSLAYTDSSYIWSNFDSLSSVSSSSDNSIKETKLDLACESAILIDQSTGKVLYEQNSHEQLRPASVTKVMTILLIMEALDSGKLSYTDQIPCSENASSMGGSQIWLDSKETLSVDEMLKAICVVSANDYGVQK